MKILIVGDRPSNLTRNNRSICNLYKWLKYLNLPIVSFCNSSDPSVYFYICKYSKVIALGNNSSNILNGLSVPHFKLPHPSPRNRKLNDINFIYRELKQCADYIGVLK